MQQPGRLRLRPWLEEQIHSGRYPGVSWLDQSARIFQIPWTHAARHGWSIDKDATLFRSWAIHTGRYHPGKDEPDPKTWKANFRCALNSLPDVCELQEHSRKRGSNAHRVYRMLPCTPALRRKRGLRLGRARHTHAASGSETRHTWSHATARLHSDAPQGVEAPAGDVLSSHTQAGTWEAEPGEQEQTEAVFKLMDQLNDTDLWNHRDTEQHRKWRTHTLWDHWHSTDDDASYFLHTESCTDLFGPHFKELSDWSMSHQQPQLCTNGSLSV